MSSYCEAITNRTAETQGHIANQTEGQGHIASISDICLTGQIILVLQIIYIPVIVVGSVLIIAAITLLEKLHRPHEVILYILAIADLIIGICWPVYIVFDLYELDLVSGLSIDRWKCSLNFYLIAVVNALAFDCLIVECVDRYLMIKTPVWYKRHVTIKTNVLVILGFVVLRLICGAAAFVDSLYNVSEEWSSRHCVHDAPFWYGWYATGAFIVGAFQTTVAYSLCAVVFFVVLKKRKNNTTAASKAKYLKEKQSVVFLAVLMFSNLLLWLPASVYLLIDGVLHLLNYEYVHKFRGIALAIRLLNSGVNAPIYAATRPVYRSAFRFLLTTPPWRWRNLQAWINKNLHLSRENSQRMVEIQSSEVADKDTSQSLAETNV